MMGRIPWLLEPETRDQAVAVGVTYCKLGVGGGYGRSHCKLT